MRLCVLNLLWRLLWVKKNITKEHFSWRSPLMCLVAILHNVFIMGLYSWEMSLTMATIAASKAAVIWSAYRRYRSDLKHCSRFYWKCILSIYLCWIIVFCALFLKNKTHFGKYLSAMIWFVSLFPNFTFFFLASFLSSYRNSIVNYFPATEAASWALWGLKHWSARKQGWLPQSVSALTFTCIRNHTCRIGDAKTLPPPEQM